MFKKITLIIVFLAFTLLSYKTFQSHIFTFHFVDEDENIIAGYYMTKGEKLYSDIFSHKQPLPAVISMVEQKTQKPNSLYLLIKRHREFVYFYSIIWGVILILTFGSVGLVFSISIEIIKQFLLGGLFLSESLVFFPAVFVLGVLLKFLTKPESENKVILSIFSISIILIIFLQFTLIPFAVLAFLLILVTTKKKKLLIGMTVFFSLLFLLSIGNFVDYKMYVENTKNAISTIYIGGNNSGGIVKMIMNSFLKPIEILIAKGSSEWISFLKIISIFYICSLGILLTIKKDIRKIIIIGYILLGISNPRITDVTATFYGGFHSLPWLALFVWILIYQLTLVISNVVRNPAKRNILSYILILLITILPLYYSKFLINDYYRKANRETDWYVNYSRFYDYGQLIRVLSKKGNKLMVLPAEQLIYWQSGLPHASRFLYVYLFVNPQYKKELYDYWDKTPPEFLYDERNGDLFKKWIGEYVRVRKGDYDTPLFMRKDTINNLKEWQMKEMKRLNFYILDKN